MMVAVYLLKDGLLWWLSKHGLLEVYVPARLSFAQALRANEAVVNGLFLYETGNILLCVWLINSLEQAPGFLAHLVKGLAYLLATIYVVGLTLSFLPAFLPRFPIG